MLVHLDYIDGKSRGDIITQRVISGSGSFKFSDKPLDILQQMDFL